MIKAIMQTDTQKIQAGYWQHEEKFLSPSHLTLLQTLQPLMYRQAAHIPHTSEKCHASIPMLNA